MINNELLELLRCPRDKSPLASAEQQLVNCVNQQIAAGQLVNSAGQVLKKQIGGGLINLAGDLMYPIIDGIPVLLPDEAIDLSQVKRG